MLSMTGFGRSCVEAAKAGVWIQVEIHSVNRKTLDIQISAPREWSGYEAICNEWINNAFQRGRVNVQIKVESAHDSSDSLAMNTDAMAESLNNLKDFADEQGFDFTPDCSLILDLARSLKDRSSLPDWKELKDALREAFKVALADINAMRLHEGAALAKDLKERITELETFRRKIEKNAAGSTQRYRDALLERL